MFVLYFSVFVYCLCRFQWVFIIFTSRLFTFLIFRCVATRHILSERSNKKFDLKAVSAAICSYIFFLILLGNVSTTVFTKNLDRTLQNNTLGVLVKSNVISDWKKVTRTLKNTYWHKKKLKKNTFFHRKKIAMFTPKEIR